MLPSAVLRFMPKRERPEVPKMLLDSLLAYREVRDCLASAVGDWNRLKLAIRQLIVAAEASRLLHRETETMRYVYMTAFDSGKLLGQPSRLEILDHACNVLLGDLQDGL